MHTNFALKKQTVCMCSHVYNIHTYKYMYIFTNVSPNPLCITRATLVLPLTYYLKVIKTQVKSNNTSSKH